MFKVWGLGFRILGGSADCAKKLILWIARVIVWLIMDIQYGGS